MKQLTQYAWLMVAATGLSIGIPSARADLQRFLEVAPGIYRGDQPDNQEDYDTLKSHGVRTIINLRNDRSVGAEREVARKMGMEFENIPMSGLAYPEESTVEHALSIVSNTHAQPVYIHCRYGKDRTGLIMALYRVRFQNWPRKEAYREWTRMGFSEILINLSSYFYLHTPDLD